MTSQRQGLARRPGIGHLRVSTVAVLALLVVAQVGSALHFLLVYHALDPESGHVVGCGVSTEHSVAPEQGLRAVGFDHGRDSVGVECLVYAFLLEGRALESPVFTCQTTPAASARVSSYSETYYAHPRRLYLLAPSTSPPFVSDSRASKA